MTKSVGCTYHLPFVKSADQVLRAQALSLGYKPNLSLEKPKPMWYISTPDYGSEKRGAKFCSPNFDSTLMLGRLERKEDVFDTIINEIISLIVFFLT